MSIPRRIPLALALFFAATFCISSEEEPKSVRAAIATWELLGAPDPRLLPGEAKILAEPVITQDKKHVYLHIRSNVLETGYVLTKASKSDLYPGKAWSRFRAGRASPSAHSANPHTRLSQIARFHILHDPRDAPAAARFRCELPGIGAEEVPLDTAGAAIVLLLTNRTSIRWLVEHAHRSGRVLLPVAAAAIVANGATSRQ